MNRQVIYDMYVYTHSSRRSTKKEQRIYIYVQCASDGRFPGAMGLFGRMARYHLCEAVRVTEKWHWKIEEVGRENKSRLERESV